ncbi:chromate transporter [Propionispira arboris]|uniref:Chromate transporter n=1 Tax=Propionispira arboris TaxID=84035 RepID=A0A1H6XFY4_9FIRM|nr:chromate efflux transporter [Propionispira arboris]SEJ28028.1 chromate transporter [Propionispira arboris]
MITTTPSSSGLVIRSISLWQLFWIYLKIGLTGFGPALAGETKKHLVTRLKWLSEDDFVNGLALAQLLPGATWVSLTVYVGYKIRGIVGALTCFFSFILPPFSIMLLFSYIYFTYGSVAGVSILFKGMAVVVVGLVAHAVIEIGKSAIMDCKGIVIALASVGIMLYRTNIFILLFFAALTGILLYYHSLKQQDMTALGRNLHKNAGVVNIPIKKIMLLAIVLVAIAFAASEQPILLQLGSVFFRMGALLFGGGFSMIPFIQQEVVSHYHWLTLDEFLVGIALGQVTPGPILITATFVGYKVANVSGAIAATLGIFSPSLFLVIVTAEVHQKIRNNIWVKSAIKGIAAAFVGMMLVVAIDLARYSLVNILSIVIALAAFGTLRLGKLDTVWVVISGTMIYWLLSMYYC